MLKERVVTASVLLVVFGLLLAFAPISLFALVLALVTAAAAWEWGRLTGLVGENAQIAYAIVVGLLAVFALDSLPRSNLMPWVALAGQLFWCVVPIVFYLQPKRASIDAPSTSLLIIGAPLLIIAAVCMQYLRSAAPEASNALLLYALAIVWAMDIGAYFVGRRFGQRKLAPLISPGKSWEGVGGGVGAAVLLYLLALLLVDWPDGSGLRLLVATVFAAAVSVLGDLFESRLKRAAGRKDSSQILPGHGGVLDRLDGVYAALPVFTFFWIWL